MDRNSYVKLWKKNNPDKVREHSKKAWDKQKEKVYARRKEERKINGEKINSNIKEYRQTTVRRFLSKKYSQIKKEKHRGKTNEKYKVEITLNNLIKLWDDQNGLCALTGKKMVHRFASPFTVSIDRIDSNIGYFNGNVQLVCQAINYAKNNYTNEEFLFFWNSFCEGPPPEYMI